MKVLVTGASGFLGRHLMKRLKEKGYESIGLSSNKNDLTNDGSLAEFQSIKFDVIFHLAAWTQAGDFCLYHPGEQWLINQKINTNVLNFWFSHQKNAKFISMGTSCSYEEGTSLKEDMYLIGSPIPDLFTYAMTKRMLHVGQISLSKQFGMKYLTVVPSTLYGADYHIGGKQMHFIFDLVRKILLFKKYGTPIILWGDGYQERELVHIDDFISNLLTIEPMLENDIINIGAGHGYSIRYFANIISEILGINSDNIQYDTTKYVGAKSKCLDIEKLKKYIPNRKETAFQDGIKEVVNWMEDKI